MVPLNTWDYINVCKYHTTNHYLRTYIRLLPVFISLAHSLNLSIFLCNQYMSISILNNVMQPSLDFCHIIQHNKKNYTEDFVISIQEWLPSSKLTNPPPRLVSLRNWVSQDVVINNEYQQHRVMMMTMSWNKEMDAIYKLLYSSVRLPQSDLLTSHCTRSCEWVERKVIWMRFF